MLVLSRRPNEKIVLPTINTTVQVVSIRPGLVRLGIEAPPEVTVVREELAQGSAPRTPPPPANAVTGKTLRELNHLVRNQVNVASVGLALVRRQLRAGMTEASEATLAKIHQEFQALQQQVEQTVAQAVPRRPDRTARKALVVEDNHNERELLAGFLRLAGLDVVTAGDGSDALDYLRDQGQPDVVLLDMALPRCDGPTTVRAIRRQPALAGLKIFAVSGHPPERFALADGTAGVDRWFSKPLDPEAFLKDLSRELDFPG